MHQPIRENLCRQFCAYYKPSRKEDLVCGGFVVIERLFNKGRDIICSKPDKVYDYEMQDMLVQAMCTACPFYQNDCDFILAKLSHSLKQKGSEKPLPCGGFILLTQLLESNIINIDDIRNII